MKLRVPNYIGVAIAALSCCACLTQAQQDSERPNIIFILSDDQGWNDYGFMGHKQIQTPNLDKLAEAGLIYERGYVTAPLCRPSLASLATGLYPHETGIRGNDPDMPKGTNKKTHLELFGEMRAKMTAPFAECTTFIELLKDNGYLTLQTGKWWEENPLDHGFTDAMTHGDATRGGRHGDKGLEIGRETMKPFHDIVEKSKKEDKPFFMWYGVFLPHTPHNAPDRLYNKYKDIAPNESTARYWANVDWFDEGCGQIVEHLKEQGLYENTIFVYTCDNGWVPDPDKVGGVIRSKREPTEAGIRTPIFITHGATVKPIRDKETLASNIDIATTILHACGIEPPAEMSGLDLRDPVALQKRDRIFVDVYDHNSNLEELENMENDLKAWVVVDGWDKLIAKPEGKELYNLKSDPDDRNNLAAKHPEKVSKLAKLIEEWVKETPQLHK
ncbi:sulfatase family protein [Pontiella desulfatans]|nr:sulfatase-like hydrolase/transferase [Pontiella desulfatans]